VQSIFGIRLVLKRIAAGIAIGVALVALFNAGAARLGLSTVAAPTVAGPAAWTTARASGLTALLALTLDMVFGLFVTTGAADRMIRRGHSVEVHRWLSSVALALVAIHLLALTLDRFVRFDLLDLVVPFLSSYRRIAVGVGVLVAYGAVVVHASFGLRGRIGVKNWRRLHYLSFFVFAAAVIHAFLAGSDSTHASIQAIYVSAATVVGLLAVYRVVSGLVS
jgi:sulfoxide reductase heme-binding subunit YedZ